MNVNPYQWPQRKIVRMLRRGILTFTPAKLSFGILFQESWTLKSKRNHWVSRPRRLTKHQKHMRRMAAASLAEFVKVHRKLAAQFGPIL